MDQIIHQHYHRLAQKHGLSLEQFHLLMELDELMLDVNNEVVAPTVNALAKNVSVSQNTVSERITRLEKRGYVQRRVDDGDRRVSRVLLTDAGRALVHSMATEAETAFLRTALGKMSREELTRFLECYDTLIDHLSAAGDGC